MYYYIMLLALHISKYIYILYILCYYIVHTILCTMQYIYTLCYMLCNFAYNIIFYYVYNTYIIILLLRDIARHKNCMLLLAGYELFISNDLRSTYLTSNPR